MKLTIYSKILIPTVLVLATLWFILASTYGFTVWSITGAWAIFGSAAAFLAYFEMER